MAGFKLYKHDLAQSTALNNDYKATASEAIADGEALVNTGGAMTKCGSTATPDFISNSVVASATTPTVYVQAIHVLEEQEWETYASVTVASSLIGSKVTINSTADGVTATTTNGVFEVTYTDGVTNGGVVRGRFRQ